MWKNVSKEGHWKMGVVGQVMRNRVNLNNGYTRKPYGNLLINITIKDNRTNVM